MWGLEHSENSTYTQKTVTSRIARYSYGICCAEIFDPQRHLEYDRFTSESDGKVRARRQMRWLLQRVCDMQELVAAIFLTGRTNVFLGR
jgi:hypothetical protein